MTGTLASEFDQAAADAFDSRITSLVNDGLPARACPDSRLTGFDLLDEALEMGRAGSTAPQLMHEAGFSEITRLNPEWHPGFDYHICRVA